MLCPASLKPLIKNKVLLFLSSFRSGVSPSVLGPEMSLFYHRIWIIGGIL
jgi:hypothetical protein